MKKLLLLGIALLTMGGMAHAQLQMEIVKELKTLDEVKGKTVVIQNKAEDKCICFPKEGATQEIVYVSTEDAFASNCFLFKVVPCESEGDTDEGVVGNYYLRTVNPDGSEYTSPWGGNYFNSQPINGGHCFTLHKSSPWNGGATPFGQDITYGSVWSIEENEGTFAIKNVGTGKYLKDDKDARYDDPTYFTFYTVDEKVVADDTDPGVTACPEDWVDLIENGNCNKKTKNGSFYVGADAKATIKAGWGRMGGNGIQVISKEGAANPWSTQFFIVSSKQLPAGTKVHLAFDYRASKTGAKISTQIQAMPGTYAANFNNITCGRNWQHYEVEFTTGEYLFNDEPKDRIAQSIAFNLNENKDEAIEFYFDNMEMWAQFNAIEKPAYAGEGAKLVDLADFKAVGAGKHYDSGSKEYSDRTGEATWDPETKTFKSWCGFQWDGEGLDASEYRYLVITPAKNMQLDGYEVNIKDKNGKLVGGDDYGVDFRNLWFGEWNNHSCMSINLEKLRIDKEFDLYHITDLVIDGGSGFTLGTVYLTNQEPKNSKNWNGDNDADIKIENLPEGKYGTICLPYRAVAAAATVYEIIGKDETGITLGEVEGFMEAGKPYIYKNNGQNRYRDDDEAKTNKVFFYKASKEAEVEAPVENNGLIGTFTAITSEDIASANNFVLSGNKIYNLEGATGENAVNIGKNRAYINMSKVQNLGGGDIKIFFDAEEGTTDINEIVNVLNDGKFYDLLGREVANPVKGNIYIVNGKKIIFK